MKRHARSHADVVLRAAALPLCLLASLCLDDRAAYSQGAQVRPAASQPKAQADEPGWETVSLGGVTMRMPGKPERQTQTVQSPAGPMEVIILGLDRPGEAFMVSYNEFPAQIANSPVFADPKVLLDAGRDGALRNVEGKLTGERDLDFNGHPGREFTGEIPAKRSAFVARAYWVKPRLYQIIYMHAQGTKVSADAQKFLDSLKTEKPAAPAN